MICNGVARYNSIVRLRVQRLEQWCGLWFVDVCVFVVTNIRWEGGKYGVAVAMGNEFAHIGLSTVQ